jgi:ClpP class serine protease
MPSWSDILGEIQSTGSTHDVVRRKYLEQLHELTGRNVIAYYSGWLQKPDVYGVHVNDADKGGFMTTIYQMEKDAGLDLILHTPGGDVAATESIVNYLRSVFGTDIRAIVPQLALSAGTMIACACKEVVMGKHSSLGPIDPQFNGTPAHGILEEFAMAKKEVEEDPSTVPVWQVIISKYHPTLIGECMKAIKWSKEMTEAWLLSGMLENEEDAQALADQIISELADHAVTLNHARHISLEKARDIGLKVAALEDDDKLQDAVLSVHHAFIHTLASTSAFKVIENHSGVASIQIARQAQVSGVR